MMGRRCGGEKELQQLLELGAWPEAGGSHLRAHVEQCRNCQDRILLTETFCRERRAASAEARMAAPGLLWWRAQLRRRNRAIDRMEKPIFVAHLFALAVVASLLGTALALGAAKPYGLLSEPGGWQALLQQLPAWQWESLWTVTWGQANPSLLSMAPAMGILLLCGVAVCLAPGKQ